MAKATKYDIEGKETGKVEISDEIAGAQAHAQSVKDYIVAIRENARQWSASTRGRKEVAHSGQKPHKQKGTGNARQGSLASPQYKGGGVVFGPRPKFDQHVRINRKERRQAIRALFGEKIRSERFFVLEDVELKEPKTRTFAECFKAMGIKGRTLVLGSEGKHIALKKSVSNLPKVDFGSVATVSGYDLMRATNVILTESAVGELR